MSQNNLGSMVVAAFALAATAPIIPCKMGDDGSQSIGKFVSFEPSYKSGPLMTFYSHSSQEYIRTKHDSDKIDNASIAMQTRFLSMKRSFQRYSKGFSSDKQKYITFMANALCNLDFNDNVSSYNPDDASIDMVLKLSNGLKLSISSFIDEDIDAPMVFSIHRGHTLLVSDELPVNEIVQTINSVTV